MARVFLTHGHHGLYDKDAGCFARLSKRLVADGNSWTELTESMLDRPIMGYGGKETTDPIVLAVHRAALTALMSLDGFVSAVSFKVSGTPPQLTWPKRLWGQIYLAETGETVVTFSHDTRHDNCPFDSLIDWVEAVPIGDSKDGVWAQWQDTEKWQELFRKRLVQTANDLVTSAAKRIAQANKMHSQCAAISEALAASLPSINT